MAQQEQRSTTGLNLQIPLDLSVKVDRLLCDLKETGHRISKQAFILNCVELQVDELNDNKQSQ